MKVSIIIPTYNEETNIEECLSSLGNQSYKEMEIIVVDDGSQDRTVNVVRKFRSGDIKAKIYKQNHKGPGQARNKGARRAKGKILVFVDADMTFDNKFIAKLVGPIKRGKVKGTFTKDELVANYENWWARNWNYETSGSKTKRRIPANYPNKSPVFRAILKSEFERVKGFDMVGYNDDWTLSEKLGYKAELAKDAVVNHKNPATIKEVWEQASWMGRRRYKYRVVGKIIALVRASLPVSLLIGTIKSIKIGQPSFLLFKLFFDLSIFVSLISFFISGKSAK